VISHRQKGLGPLTQARGIRRFRGRLPGLTPAPSWRFMPVIKDTDIL